MVRAAVLREEPVFSYSHKANAKVVMLLPSWDMLWVLQSIKKFFSPNNSFFFNFIISLLLFCVLFKTEAKPEDKASCHSSMQSPQTLHGALAIQSIILSPFPNQFKWLNFVIFPSFNVKS